MARARREAMPRVSFKGNEFVLTKSYSYGNFYYKIVDMTINNGVLVIPESYQDYPIMEIELRGIYPRVEELVISQSLMGITLENGVFPNLKKMRAKSGSSFCTDGKLLLNHSKTKLINCLVEDGEELVIPASVEEVGDEALMHTRSKRIVFLNPQVKVEAKHFQDTAYVQANDAIVVGGRLLALNRDVPELCLPDQVEVIAEDAFAFYMPTHLKTPLLPLRKELFSRDYRGNYVNEEKLKRITITSPEAWIHVEDLKTWEELEGFEVCEDHPLYSSKDGVLFDKEKKTLLYYPAKKPEEEYQVPEGVERIGHCAFFRQTKVKKIIMPNSVKYLEEFAVMGCSSLETLILSDEVEMIPDPNPYFSRGTLSNNRKLTSIHLPAKLKYIGGDGLYNTKLQHLSLPEGLELLGRYSLYTCYLESVELPKSLMSIRNGAIYGTSRVRAYEGSAKGLVGAISPTSDKQGNLKKNDYWHKCMITVLDGQGKRKGSFYLPEAIGPEGAQALSRAWDGPAINYVAYAEATDSVKKSEDRIEMSLILVLQAPEPIAARYEPYIRRRGAAVATHLIDTDQKEAFVQYLEKKLLVLTNVEKLLEYCNQKGKNEFAAYLMDYKEQNGKKKDHSIFPL